MNTQENNMSKQEIIFEVLEATGLNWTAQKQGIVTETGIAIPDQFASVRSDNRKVLGIVGGRYEFLQNHELVAIAYESGKEVFNADLTLTHPWNNSDTLGSYGNMGGGSLRGGERVFVQLELPELHIGKSGIKRYITLTNSHDGTMSLGFGTSNQVICCANTFAIANKDVSKIRHTASMQQRIDEAVISLRNVLQFEDRQMQVFEVASGRRFEKSHIADIVKTVFGKSVSTGKDEASTRLKNQMSAFADDLNRSIDEQGETLWALFNGVTRYTNHTTYNKDKDWALMFGKEADTNQRAFETMVKWLNEPSLAEVVI